MIRFVAPMVAPNGDDNKSSLRVRTLLPLALLTLAGLLFDQWIHGRFL